MGCFMSKMRVHEEVTQGTQELKLRSKCKTESGKARQTDTEKRISETEIGRVRKGEVEGQRGDWGVVRDTTTQSPDEVGRLEPPLV